MGGRVERSKLSDVPAPNTPAPAAIKPEGKAEKEGQGLGSSVPVPEAVGAEGRAEGEEPQPITPATAVAKLRGR